MTGKSDNIVTFPLSMKWYSYSELASYSQKYTRSSSSTRHQVAVLSSQWDHHWGYFNIHSTDKTDLVDSRMLCDITVCI